MAILPTCKSEILNIACEKCSLTDICLPFGLTQVEISDLDKLIDTRLTLQKSDTLFKQDQRFSRLYAVRSGAFKSVKAFDSGKIQTVNFHFPGELIGLDAIYSEKYTATCQATNTSSVCVIPYTKLLELSQNIPSLNQQLIKLLSGNIVSCTIYNQQDMADVRLAKFLLNISTRFKQTGVSGSHLILPVAKQDIAEYLGLANETLSRLFKKFTTEQIISLNKRELIIRNFRALQKYALA